MQRLIQAFWNSARAFRHLIRHEAAFRQETAVLVVALVVGWFLAESWRGYALLIGSLGALMVVEVLNTAIEAACNATSREFHPDIMLAKDCGSLAVLLTLLFTITVWGLALLEWLLGMQL